MSSDRELRALVVASIVWLAGCPISSSDECDIDSQCSSDEVCARDSMCASIDEVRSVTVTWTVGGADANTQTCATHPDLFISFIGRDFSDTLGYTPVPCHIGQFSVDKLPTRYREVELGIEGRGGATKSISATNTATFDLR